MKVVKFREQFSHNRFAVIHNEALETFGEQVSIRRIWNWEHFEKGLVTRCSVCNAGANSAVKARISNVYKQSGDSECPSCYGVGFTGGFENVVYLVYMLTDDGSTSPGQTIGNKTGNFEPSTPSFQFPAQPRLNPGDLVVRYENWIDEDTPGPEERRYTIDKAVSQPTLRTGPGLAKAETIWTAQTGTLSGLPFNHTLYTVNMAI